LEFGVFGFSHWLQGLPVGEERPAFRRAGRLEVVAELVQRADLPSGVKAMFLPKKTRGEMVNARLTLHFGNQQSLKGYNSAGAMLADLMLRGTTEPIFLAINFLLRQVNPYAGDDVRYVPTIEESIARIKALNVDQVRKLYEEQVGGQVGELVVVGDFVPDATSSIVEDLLRDWKASTPYQRIEQGVRSTAGQHKSD
jgi:predicted Zn-dependent peptidase